MGCRRHKACMSQGNVLRHGGAEGNWVVKGTKLAYCKGMCLGTGVPKSNELSKAQSLHVKRHKACMSQGNVPRHGGAEGKWVTKGPKFTCRKAMYLGTEVPKANGLPNAQSLYVVRQCA
ncbi:hypothetical protein Pyn_12680 [Prunus yedoensis var. nudiflora]|uniref:Uncharacterized protein n=1 Tax=Prunus yedoensis var. nudiflora TaxID=2094558 RepID=A0A314ZEJ4_PRUYE|nr:hypothetical protein Pyn_12680 [Prunus yedoensis var. nudiflora]